MPPEPDQRELDDALAAGVPEIYCNSFANFVSSIDVLTVMFRNGRPAAIVNMPLSAAKAYADMLSSLIARHERDSGSIVPALAVTSDEEGEH